MKTRLTDMEMAERVLKALNDGDCVNLGTGLPTLCSTIAHPDKEIIYHAENGVLGYGSRLLGTEGDQVDFDITDAGIVPVSKKQGMCFFDMAVSFNMIRSGRLHATVLGAFEVSGRGDLANWSRGRLEASGIGGAMDLAFGAKKVIVMMKHVTKAGEPKIVNTCRYPLTAKECVDLIVTDIAVIEVTLEGLVLREYAHGWSLEEIQAITEPRLIVTQAMSI